MGMAFITQCSFHISCKQCMITILHKTFGLLFQHCFINLTLFKGRLGLLKILWNKDTKPFQRILVFSVVCFGFV